MSGERPAAPRVAVVVPIYRHSVLVSEAIASVLGQDAPFEIALILVNDGCAFQETEQVCQDFAHAYPDRVHYLHKANGGLSDARNCGIRYVLQALPQVEALYMLDADNRLRPGALAAAMAELDAHPDVDWIYPNIDMFGQQVGWDYGGPYSVLVHTVMNICEAGSLIRRSVFEEGIFFDTGFKLGWEDWDFFLTAASAGKTGRNLEHFGFQYRKRPESMLANAERDRAAIASHLRDKHRALFSTRSRLALEHAEAPRYAIYLADRGVVVLCTDPDAAPTEELDPETFAKRIWHARQAPGRVARPEYLLVASSDILAELRSAALLHWALLTLEQLSIRANIAVLTRGFSEEQRIGNRVVRDGRPHRKDARILALRAEILDQVLSDDGTDWINSLIGANCMPDIAALELQLPMDLQGSADDMSSVVISDFLALVHRFRSRPERQAASVAQWDWRIPGIDWRPMAQEIVRRSAGGAPVYPRLPDGRRHVACVLPLVEFGGVEKVALHMARGLRAHGYVPHAVIVDADDAALDREWRETFESFSFLNDEAFSAWGGGGQSFMGTDLPGWATGNPHDTALGLLCGYDAVINLHGGAIAGMLGQLRRMGVKTVQSLHLNDLTALGRPVGNTYLGLAYEHAIDCFAPCSLTLGHWLQGMGVPGDKICPVPNAPGFDLPQHALDRLRAERREGFDGASERPLRVLFLGRLDRQKGLDRLGDVMRAGLERGLDVSWRVIGKSVLGADGAPLPEVVARHLEPAVTTPEDLSAAYGWADVVLLLSRFEGLPLTVLEAMRQGAAVVATDVGATREVLNDGSNGFLVSEEDCVAQALAVLHRLAADRALLARVSDKAMRDSEGRTWERMTAELAARLAV